MPDYTADPLWDDQSGAMVSLGSLPISDGLRHRLTAWRERWEALNEEMWTTDDDSPLPDDFKSEERELWMTLRDELGSDFQVGLAVQSPSEDTRVHVEWQPGARPELPTWFR